MPSLNASSERSGERCSTTSSSSVRITYGASSLSTCASTMKRVRTKLSGTSSRFQGLLRQRDASTQSPYSVGSITTTGVSLDESCARFSWRTGFVARTGQQRSDVAFERTQVERPTLLGILASRWSATRHEDPKSTPESVEQTKDLARLRTNTLRP